MTWTKLGQEFPEDARKLSDAAFRVHVEALCWANRTGADLNVEADDLDHFSYTKDRKVAVAELVAKRWWVTTKDGWYIGEHRPEWQLEAVVVEKRAATGGDPTPDGGGDVASNERWGNWHGFCCHEQEMR